MPQFKMAGIIKQAAEATKDKQCIGAGKLVVFCNAVEDNPFMAGAFHGSGEADAVVNVGVSGPGVVNNVLRNMPEDADMTSIAEAIKATAFKITRAGELMSREASRRLGVQKGILDLSLAAHACLKATRLQKFWKLLALANVAALALQQLSPCSTTQSKKAALWQVAALAVFPAPLSPYPKMPA